MARPIQVLREQATALEAALAVCIAQPHRKAVHKLRTATRRMEAQLELLAQIKGFPPHREQAALFRQTLKSVRRLAGEVRDLDVLEQMLRALRLPEHSHRPQLLQALEDRRHKRADALKKRLKKHIPALAQVTEELFAALKPARERSLAVKDLLPIADAWYLRRTHGLKLTREEDLHSLRKAAKVSRYMAETGLPSKQADAAAVRYNRLQQSGGRWHDSLLLAQFARKTLGKNDALAQLTRDRAKSHHASFVRLLKPFRRPRG
ncbi:CHAD domain-containing protein [Terriglobus tenax]|uniref:CHAD domain-containing protein n=1 Tax=Terriglobus tenax TaxID=1111115 RepID=UPI0021E09AFE|nr:CHAD domain-containing protein [Terriglobus tenax]